METTMDITLETRHHGNRLEQKALELREIADLALRPEECLRRMATGFRDLSSMARDCGKISVYRNSLQLSHVFEKTLRTVPLDIPFTLKATIQFLDRILESCLIRDVKGGT